MSFIWLSGGLKPDHKTISHFRKTHLEVLKSELVQCARMCIKLGLIEGNTLSVDGSKLRANAVDSPFASEKFTYDKATDTYTCPKGKASYKGRYRKDGNRFEYRMPSSDCRSCQFYGSCTKAKTGRRIHRPFNQKIKEKLEKLYKSETGQGVYQKRKARVEHPFGYIKHNLGVNAFLLRGLEGVKAEYSLLSTAFNLTRMINIVGGVKPLLEYIRKQY